jgi:hypothetical protein
MKTIAADGSAIHRGAKIDRLDISREDPGGATRLQTSGCPLRRLEAGDAGGQRVTAVWNEIVSVLPDGAIAGAHVLHEGDRARSYTCDAGSVGLVHFDRKSSLVRHESDRVRAL